MKLYRAFFEKTAESIYISHLDLQRVMMRAIKKSALPIWYTEGYNPHIYLTFALPLSLGQESICESFDFKTEGTIDVSTAIEQINKGLPSGVVITSIRLAEMKVAAIASASYEIIYLKSAQLINSLNTFQLLPSAQVFKTSKKKKGTIEIDLKEYIKNIKVDVTNELCKITLSLPVGNQLTVNPSLFCEFIETNYKILSSSASIRRIEIKNVKGDIFV